MKQKNRIAQPKINEIRDVMIDAAQSAGKILKRYFRGKLKISEKPGAGLVTNADLEAQHQSVSILRKAFPKFGFLTEEAAPEQAKCPGRWIIDPLDGTTNFVHGFPMFCVSIAAEWNNELLAGVIYHPILDETYLAIKGKGATLNGKPLKVSKTRTIEKALLTTGFTYQKEKLFKKEEMPAFEKVSTMARAIRRPGSAALDLAYTASGVFDAFWERNLSPWDVAAGVLLVNEAGGKVTNLEGNPFQLENRGLLASNSSLHGKLLNLIK